MVREIATFISCWGLTAILAGMGETGFSDDRDDVQGRWVVVSRWAFNASQPVVRRETTFAADTLRLLGNEGAFILDESQRPKRMRYVVSRPDAEHPITIHYIYMLDGDELVLARKCGIGKNDGTVDPPAEFNAGLVEVIRLRRPPQP
jgi:uncharacterized protein (TIGR03067 family)